MYDFVPEPQLADFLAAADVVVLPYTAAYGASGALNAVLAARKSVLVSTLVRFDGALDCQTFAPDPSDCARAIVAFFTRKPARSRRSRGGGRAYARRRGHRAHDPRRALRAQAGANGRRTFRRPPSPRRRADDRSPLRRPRPRLSGSTAAVRFVYEHPVLLALLPFAVFFPLLDSRGLYEFGDANFPLNPFWVDYMLPWSGAASAGADNTFIGVPRLVYHLGINVLIATSSTTCRSRSGSGTRGMSALGLTGAYVLARRLGAGAFSVPLAIFYAFNLWSYDRIAQGPIYLSYQALPLVVYLLLRYLARPQIDSGAVLCVLAALHDPGAAGQLSGRRHLPGHRVREICLRGWRTLPKVALLGVAVVAANAFYIFSMIADMLAELRR